MASVLEWVIGLLVAALIPSLGAALKYRADSVGWKTSYEREKARSDEMAEEQRDSRQAVRIANAISEALKKQLEKGSTKL